MRQPQHKGVTRPLIAALTAIAFIFSPFSVMAQQEPGAGEQDEAQEGAEGEEAEPKKPAGPTPKLFLLPTQGVKDGVSSIIPERIGDMLRTQLEGKRAVELMPKYERLEEQGGGQANAAVAEAERLYTSGIGLLAAGEDKKAAETFQKAVDIMEQNIADLNNFNVLSDAYKNLALAYFNAGFDFDGRKKMKVFAHLSPEATLDKKKFPKELREVFNDETGKVKKGGPGKLIIKSDVEGATVFIDGVEKGKTPVTVEDVGYGYHYMVVRAPNGSVWSEQIRVRGRGKKQDFEVELGAGGAQAAGDSEEGSSDPAFYSGLKQGIKSGSFGKDLQPYLAELTTRTGTQFISWVAMVKGESGYVAVPFVYRTEDGLMVRGDSVEFNFELSNLRVGVSQMANHIIETVETMPEDKAITSVVLGAPKEEEKPTPADDGGEAVATTSGDTSAASEQSAATKQSEAGESTDPAEGKDAVAVKAPDKDKDESVTPLPEPSDKEGENDKWLWIGAGSAAVVVTGLVVGGLMYADGGSDEPGSFEAQLTW